LLASYSQRNQLLEALSRPPPRLAAWTVVCLSTHTSRVGKHGTQSGCLRGKKLAVPEMWLKKRSNKKVTNKRCNLVTL
jgi:hypothetical protein